MATCKCKSQVDEKKVVEQGLKDYPGVAVNSADDDRVDSAMVKERTAVLNNNPNGKL